MCFWKGKICFFLCFVFGWLDEKTVVFIESVMYGLEPSSSLLAHITVGEERCNDSEPDEQQPSSIVFKLAPKLLTPQAHPLLTLRAT